MSVGCAWPESLKLFPTKNLHPPNPETKLSSCSCFRSIDTTQVIRPTPLLPHASPAHIQNKDGTTSTVLQTSAPFARYFVISTLSRCPSLFLKPYLNGRLTGLRKEGRTLWKMSFFSIFVPDRIYNYTRQIRTVDRSTCCAFGKS